MATQNTDLKEAKKDAIMTPDMYRSMFLRQFTSQCSQSYDKMMAMGFMYTIQKPLRKIYPNDDDYYAALDRHTEFFNITPHVLPFVAGLTVSMEEQAAADKNFDTSSINAMKVGLMGPLAGVGDPICWGTLRPVLAALGAGIALTGSIMGPLIFFLVFNAIRLATNWYGVMYGYSKGTELVDEMGGNKMRFLTEGSSVLGLLVMGALVAKWTTVNMPLVLSSYTNSAGEQVTTTVQTILDSLMPGIVPLLMTFACMWLLRKNVNPLIIILGLFALGIVGYAIGLFA